MSADLETLRREMQELGYPREAIVIVEDTANKVKVIEDAQDFPHLVELAEAEEKAADGDQEAQLGLDAREIAIMPEFQLRGGSQRVDFGDVGTRFGGVLSVCSYDVKGEDLLVGEKGRLAIVVRKPGADSELRRVMRIGLLGLFGEKRAVELNTNLRGDFGTVDVPTVHRILGRSFVSPDDDVEIGSKEDIELARLLVDRVQQSRRYLLLQQERATHAPETR